MLTLLYAVFILSGGAGLMYESIWARYLGLFLGHSAYAQAMVLVIFMGGMSVGAFIAGERSARLKSPLLWYAGIELVAGLIGLLFHDAFLGLTSFAYDTVFPALGTGGIEVIVKWLLAALLILPQSLLLGATFPLMSAGVMRLAPDRGGRSLAMLYFANSFGAAAGVLVSGFYLVALAGLPGTLVVAAILNIVVALAVFIAVKRLPASHPNVAPIATEPSAAGADRMTRVLLIVAFGTAVASFVYEIAWIRMLSLVLGSATHSFELMLSAFILGLALGAYWIRTRVDSGSLRLLALVQIAMGSLAIAALPVYIGTFTAMAQGMSMFSRTDTGYQAMSLFRYALCLAVMLPATFCAGMTLPVITKLLLNAGAGERAIGRVYGINTLGAIVGIVLASLVLMPILGLKWLLVLGGCIDLALGALIFATDRNALGRRTRALSIAGSALALVLIVVLARTRFDHNVLTSGVFRYGTVQRAGEGDIRFYRDGRTASVSVRKLQATGGITLATNGKPDASLGPEWFQPAPAGAPRGPFTHNASTQLLSGILPLAFVPDAKDVAVIGQGSGMSSHVLLGSPNIRELVTIEIEPEMIRGSRFFYPANRRVFDDPRASFAIDDARSYLSAGGRQYDLILSEPSNPWVAGISGLFTVEFYDVLKEYITDDGILGQWLQVSEIDDGLVLSVIAALSRAFPSYAVFAMSDNHVMIIASKQPKLPVPDWTVVTRFPGVAEDLSRITPLPPRFFETLRIADQVSLGPLAALAAPNSDFYPVLDLYAERAMFTRRAATGFASLGADRFSVSLALAQARNGLSRDTALAILGIPRLSAAATSARTRVPARANNPAAAQNDFRNDVVRQSLLRGDAPADWRAWVIAIAFVDADVHGGAAGVADTAFYESIERFLRRTSPPPEARSAIAFLRGLSAWNYALIRSAGEPLLAAASRGDLWLPPDLIRDGLVTARLAAGDREGARAAFATLAPYSLRPDDDLRTLMLASLLQDSVAAGQ